MDTEGYKKKIGESPGRGEAGDQAGWYEEPVKKIDTGRMESREGRNKEMEEKREEKQDKSGALTGKSSPLLPKARSWVAMNESPPSSLPWCSWLYGFHRVAGHFLFLSLSAGFASGKVRTFRRKLKGNGRKPVPPNSYTHSPRNVCGYGVGTENPVKDSWGLRPVLGQS